MNPFQPVNDFESAVSEYAGSRYAVAVDSCSSAIFLCCRYLSVGKVYLPRTYCSVPAAVLHAGGSVEWVDCPWAGEYRLDPYPIIDSAGRFRRDMHQPSTFRCVCFHWTKILPCGKGGMILHDDPEADEWFRLARYSGRHACDQFSDPGFVLAGWNLYMDPVTAARGLTLLKNLPDTPPDVRTQDSYPELEANPIYSTDDMLQRYAIPPAYDVSESWSDGSLSFRPIAESDAALVMRWRNPDEVRRWFFDDRELTTEMHADFCRNRKPEDHVWIVSEGPTPLGMASLTIARDEAEYGRLVIDPAFKGMGFAERIERSVMRHGIKTLGMRRLWGEYLAENAAIAGLHRKTGWKVCDYRDHPRGRVVIVEHP